MTARRRPLERAGPCCTLAIDRLQSHLGAFIERLAEKATEAARSAPAKAANPAVNDILMKRAAKSSADFIERHLASSLLIRHSDEVRNYAIRHVMPEGLLLELGVFRGVSINQFAEVLTAQGDTRTIYGFDAFAGLSEDRYGKSLAKSVAFNRKGQAPKVSANVQLLIGWVEDTLAPFLNQNPGPIAFMHIDTDTYSPCRLALELLP